MEHIARIITDFDSKFGVPRQAGLVPELTARIVFEPEYRSREALRGLDGFSHIWLIWEFSGFAGREWSPTVRPPRLGGNERLGVFATRSPHRPNPIGLSCVELLGIDYDCADGPCLTVGGADLANGTPIYDIKPYVPYTDARPDARGGFAREPEEAGLGVQYADGVREGLLARIGAEKLAALEGALRQDPRPRYQDDPERVYGLGFAGTDVRFRIMGNTVYITGFEPLPQGGKKP